MSSSRAVVLATKNSEHFTVHYIHLRSKMTTTKAI